MFRKRCSHKRFIRHIGARHTHKHIQIIFIGKSINMSTYFFYRTSSVKCVGWCASLSLCLCLSLAAFLPLFSTYASSSVYVVANGSTSERSGKQASASRQKTESANSVFLNVHQLFILFNGDYFMADHTSQRTHFAGSLTICMCASVNVWAYVWDTLRAVVFIANIDHRFTHNHFVYYR